MIDTEAEMKNKENTNHCSSSSELGLRMGMGKEDGLQFIVYTQASLASSLPQLFLLSVAFSSEHL